MKYAKQCNGKFKQIKDRQDVITELVDSFYISLGKSYCLDHTLAKDLIFRIHKNFDLLPNDWIYDKVHCMLLNNDEGDVDDSVDGYIDIYTTDLIEWSKQFHGYVDVTLGEYTMPDCITQAQYNVLNEIVGIINDFIDEQLGV